MALADGEQQALSGRELILDTAADAFVRDGYEGASLRRIADAVGMKAGSLYYHFASKDELLTEVLRRGIEVMHVALDDADRRNADAPPRQRLAAYVRAHLAALFEHGSYTAVHVTSFRTAPAPVRLAVVPLRDGYEARWTALLTALRADAAMRPDASITMVRISLLGAMNAAIDWFDPARGSLDSIAEAITDTVWSGVAAHPGQDSS